MRVFVQALVSKYHQHYRLEDQLESIAKAKAYCTLPKGETLLP